MSDEFDIPEFIVKLNLNFKAIRVVGNKMIPTTWSINTEVIYEEVEDDETGDKSLDLDLEIRTTISKIKYWVENVLEGSILFCADNPWAYHAFFDEAGKCSMENTIVMLPSEPSDDLVAEVLHSKMNALGNPHVEFGVVELTSDDKTGFSYLFVGNGEMNLPTMDEWVGDHAYFDKPWWARNDGSTIDTIPPEGADVNEKPSYAFSLDFIRQQYRKQFADEAVVIRPNFTPRVIDGGKE